MADENEIQVADWLAEDYAELQTDPDYVTQGILIDLAVQIGEIMDAEGIESQQALADHLGMSPSAVSQIMSGDQNMSIERLVRIALSLGRTVEVEFVDQKPPEVEAVPTQTTCIDLSDDVTAEDRTERSFSWTTTPDTGASWAGQMKDRPEPQVHIHGAPVPAEDVDDKSAA